MQIAPMAASDEQILAVHTQEHLRRLIAVERGERTVRLDPDTYALPVSLDVARLAAGAVIGAVDAVLIGASGQCAGGCAAAGSSRHCRAGDGLLPAQ